MTNQLRILEIKEIIDSTINIQAIRGVQHIGNEESLGKQFNNMVNVRVNQVQLETYNFFSSKISGCRTPIGALSALKVAREDLSEGCLTPNQYDELWIEYNSRTDAI